MILVTGATGNIGGQVCRCLTDRQAPFVRGVTDPVADSDRALDFLNPSTFESALADVDRVFLVRPPALSKPEQDMRPFLQACQRFGITHLVFLSLQGAANNPWTPHAKIETIVREIGLPYTFLQPSFFMQNLTMQHAAEIRQRDELFMPAGNGKTNFIDARDIAAVAAIVLNGSGYEGRSFELTGSSAFDYHEVAQMLSKTLGRAIVYRRPGLLRFLWRSWRGGNPLSYALVTGVIYTIARLGKADGHSNDLPVLLGRQPTRLEDFIEEHKDVWLNR